MNEHLTDVDIANYLDDPEGCQRRAEIEAHVAGCAPCRDTLGVTQRFDADMDAALMWDFMVAARQRAATPYSLVALAQQIDAEEREATDYLRSIVMSPYALRRAALSEKPVLHTVGVVRVLCDAARKLREQDPKNALTVANEAASIAELLPQLRYDDTMRAEMRASAQLERANALRYLGRFEEALEALDAAEAAYRLTPLPERQLAITMFVRSGIYMKSERLDEAATLARQCVRVFRMYGDRARVVHAQMVIGGVLFYRREYPLARELYSRLLPEAREINEPASEARCLVNLAHVERELGEYASSLLHYSLAADSYERLGLRTELLRARWGSAKLVVVMGNITDGTAQLRNIGREMLVLGMTNDHALVMLGAVGYLFAIGELEELPAICTDLVHVFGEAKMPQNARTALAYLDAAAAGGAVTEPLLVSVTKYIEREDYETAFLPPPA
jgi:tetratricopeptide (TPR) repeat protein